VRAVVATAIILLFSAIAGAGDLVIQPTTTLTAETANNTSGADSFTTQSNGNPAPANISKLPVRRLLYPGASTKIYAHFMPWFGGANHMWVGYRSDDRTQVRKQVTDMMSRGYDGAIVDWYGPDFARENNTTLYLRDEAETRAGLFTFAVMEDVGSLNKCANTAGCDVTQKLINDLNYAAATYYPSPAYLRIGGRPVMFFFGVDKYVIDWNRVRLGANGNPLFIFRQASAFTHAQTDGGFSWVGFPSSTSDIGLAYLDDFYTKALQYPSKQTFGSAYPGFDNSLAAWASSPPKIVQRNCGQTWLASLAEAGKFYSSANQLPSMQMVTWNDYEEGSELETGIDSCASVSAAVSGSVLSWTLAGSASVVDHFNVFVSLDGENLMKLASLGAAQRSLDLAGFGLAPGSYTLHVQAYAKPSLRNAMSNAVAYTLVNQPPLVAVALDRASGVAPETVAATVTASDADGTVASSVIDFGDGSAPVSAASAAHQYATAGSYTITATATDDRGATSTATATVTIAANQAPLAALALSPGSGLAPLAVTASAANSSDADGSIVSSSIDFGDGTVAAGPSASHTYTTAGNKTVTVTVTDDKGATATASGTVSVSAAAVSIAAPQEGASVTSPVRVVASGLSGSEVWLTQVYLDGVKQTEAQGAAIDITLNPAPGTRRITVQCYDRAGNIFKASVNVTVQAPNQPPVAALSVTPTSGMAALTVAASAAGSSDPDGTITATTLDFGDGYVTNAAGASHVYAKVGTYTVRASVTDDRGATATASQVVTVQPGVRIGSPLNGTTTRSQVRVTANAVSASPITLMRVYVDNVSRYSVAAASLDTTVSNLRRGTRTITVQAWDAAGAVYKSSVVITVR